MKYRKKPVVIEAEQYHEVDGPSSLSAQFQAVICNAPDRTIGERAFEREFVVVNPHIHTLEGYHEVTSGDWIIQGVKGEFYPCKPDIFAMTYEPV